MAPVTPKVLLSVVAPVILVLPPTFRFLAIPAPPLTTSAPFAVVVDSCWLVIFNWDLAFTLLENLTSLLNVTGPSNWERIVPELPPSTTSRSLTVTSSNTALNLDGSSPVTVGIGLSNVISSPVDEDVLRLPIKESPLLFIPV